MPRIKILTALMLLSSLAIADTHQSRLATEIHAIKNTASLGILFGWKYMAFESDKFAVGGAGYTGEFGGTSSGNLSYGGIYVSQLAKLSQSSDFEFGLLTGGGGGTVGTTSGSGIVLEPTLAWSVLMGQKVRTVLNVGYLWMPTAASIGGISGGLRFEFALN